LEIQVKSILSSPVAPTRQQSSWLGKNKSPSINPAVLRGEQKELATRAEPNAGAGDVKSSIQADRSNTTHSGIDGIEAAAEKSCIIFFYGFASDSSISWFLLFVKTIISI
jgi:hypothetical protein